MESTCTKQWWLLSSVSWLGATCLYASLATSLHSVTPLLLTLVSLNLASAVQVCHHNHHYHPHFSHCPGSGGCEAEAERPVAGGQLAEDAECAGHRRDGRLRAHLQTVRAGRGHAPHLPRGQVS